MTARTCAAIAPMSAAQASFKSEKASAASRHGPPAPASAPCSRRDSRNVRRKRLVGPKIDDRRVAGGWLPTSTPRATVLFGERRARGAAFGQYHGPFEARAGAADEQRSAGGDQSPNGKNYRQRAHVNLPRISTGLSGRWPISESMIDSIGRRGRFQFGEMRDVSRLIHVMGRLSRRGCRRG